MAAKLDQFDPDNHVMSFGDHLDELRLRLVLALLPPVPLAVLMYFFSGTLLEWICLPLRRTLRAYELSETLQVLGPAEALLTQIKISVIAALIISAPWILWQAWLFVRPGLYRNERRFVYFLVPGSAIFTALGVGLFYFVMLPFVLSVLIKFGTVLDDRLSFDVLRDEGVISADVTNVPLGHIPVLGRVPDNLKAGDTWINLNHELLIVVPVERGADPANPPLGADGVPIPPALEIFRIPLVRAAAISQEFQLAAYVSFVLLLMLGMAIAFQTPIVMLLLGWMDILRPESLRGKRRHAMFVTGIISAIITPTADIPSMLAMMIPLYLLFELGLLMMRLFPASRVAGGAATRPITGDRSGRGRSDRFPDPPASGTDEMNRNDESGSGGSR